MDSRFRGNDRVANTTFYPKNKEHRKYIYKQQVHPGEGRKRPKELQDNSLIWYNAGVCFKSLSREE
jgi:hypothetical protein